MTESHEQKVVGVMGGMGPEATVECFESIVDQTAAETDQDHIPVIVFNRPQVPDRTAAILHDGEDPTPFLTEMATGLQRAGADFLITPCNTAHFFIDRVEKEIDIPILNMPEAAIQSIPRGSTAGLLATDGTIETGLYDKYAESNEVQLKIPEAEDQKRVMEVIYGQQGIKAGYSGTDLTQALVEVAEKLKEEGVQYIIAGCTEIRIVLEPSDLRELTLIRPIDVICRRAIERAGGKLELSEKR
ncbi:MAG: aspartate/glutamate racemase family protein [Candidatus Acetothermia bacterium]